jgi:hypothetical protein
LVHKAIRAIFTQHGITGSTPFICAEQGHLYRQDMWRLQVAGKAALLLMFQSIKPYLKHRKRIQNGSRYSKY